MLAAVLGFGLFWPAVAPELVTPGMTFEQVEAILGQPDVFLAFGPPSNPSITRSYFNYGVTINYFDGEVKTVSRRK